VNSFANFAVAELVPAAQDILLARYEEHKSGEDIGVENKGDGSPASHADREAEQVMRALIEKKFPAHGIIGEEFGLKNPKAEYVWVLDPLDGTREFLAKEAGWGTLIALMRNGRPVVGIIHDALNNITWRGGDGKAVPKAPPPPKILAEASVACTALSMFDSSPWKAGAKKMFESCKEPRPRLNCLGFAYVADGVIDLAAESSLKLHDIAALLPVLWDAGAQCVTPDGAYRDHVFNLANAEKESYTLVTGRDPALVKQALAILGGQS
jgi:inositol-phosphate phosphatase / L-galactose 1-phosphate phosphatase / histidinol-phosphatase